MLLECDNCRREFKPWRRDQRFCEKRCGTRWHKRGGRPEPPRVWDCYWCGDPIVGRKSGAHWCSRECAGEASRAIRAIRGRPREEGAAERVKRWRVRNPEAYARQWRGRCARARRRGLRCEAVDILELLAAYDYCCGICGGKLDLTDWHLDHIVPLSRGGSHERANVQPSHPACNMAKGARLDHEGVAS